MGFYKGHKEFHTLDMSDGWHTLSGYPPGIEEKIIAGTLDEKAKLGNLHPPAFVSRPEFTPLHPSSNEYWEEVFLLSGDLTVGNDAGGQRRTEVRRLYLRRASARRCPWTL